MDLLLVMKSAAKMMTNLNLDHLESRLFPQHLSFVSNKTKMLRVYSRSTEHFCQAKNKKLTNKALEVTACFVGT